MNPATAAQMADLIALQRDTLEVLTRIETGMFWACVWLFCILAFKGGSK